MAVGDWPRSWSNNLITYTYATGNTANFSFAPPTLAPERKRTELEMLDERIDGVCTTGRAALS